MCWRRVTAQPCAKGWKESKKEKGEMNVNWKMMLIAVLAVCLVVSLFFNGYLYYDLTRSAEHQSPTFFSFVWSPEAQNITEGPLYINMTFERIGENLSVTIKINDDDYCVTGSGGTGPDALLLWFDVNGDGYISWPGDPGSTYYWLKPNNRTLFDVIVDPYNLTLGPIQPSATGYETESPFHTCVFMPEEGYIFNCTFPLKYKWFSEISRAGHDISSDVVTLRFTDVNGSVYIPPFHFGVDVKVED